MIIIIIIDYWLLLIIIINIIIIIYIYMLHNAFFHDIPGEYFQIFGVAMPYPTYPTVWPRRYLLPAFEALRKTRQRRDFCRREPHNYVSELGFFVASWGTWCSIMQIFRFS